MVTQHHKFFAAVGATCLMVAASVQPVYADSQVYGVFRDSGFVASGSDIVTMTVPKGVYAIFAKLNLNQDSGLFGLSATTISCRLSAGFNSDDGVVRLPPTGTDKLDLENMPLEIFNKFTSSNRSLNVIRLKCTHTSPQLSFNQAKILAIKVDVGCNQLSPSSCIAAP